MTSLSAQEWTKDTLPAGLISWWRGENTPSDALGRNSGYTVGNVTYEDGKFGKAFRFHGSPDSVVTADSSSLDLKGPFTMEAWIKLATDTNDPRGPGRAIFSKVGGPGGNNGYQLALNLASDRSVIGGNFNSPGQSWDNANYVSANVTPSLPIGRWMHVAFTYNDQLEILYLNGKPLATNDVGSHQIANSSSAFRISGDDNQNVFFDGWIDEARIYGRALSSDEIAMIYAGPQPPPVITHEPASQFAYEGTIMELQVNAISTTPMTCQWMKNGSPLIGATNTTLNLSPVQFTDAGNYQAILTNNNGSATSRVAILSVKISPKPMAHLTAWWPGDNNARDIAGGNNGSLFGDAGFTSAKMSAGFLFSGASGGVTMPDNAALNPTSSGFTVEFWMKGSKNQPESLFDVVDKSHGWVDSTGWMFQGDSASGVLSFGMGLNRGGATDFVGVNSQEDVLDGEYHHIAGTWDGSQMQMFVDGVETGSIPLTNPVNNTRSLNLGYSWGAGQSKRFFKGNLDELAIYNRALSAQEIAAIVDAPTFMGVAAPSSCVFWLSGDGHTLDLTTKHNDGMPGAAVGFVPGKVGEAMRFIESPESYVELPNSPLLQPSNNTLTIEAWIKPDFSVTGPEGVDTILIKRDNCDMVFPYNFVVLKGGLGKVGNLAFAALPVVPYPAIISTQAVPDDGLFHHVAVTFNGNKPSGNCVFYIDGQAAGGGDAPGVLPLAAAPAVIGRHAGCGHYSSMILDEVAFYNRELDKTEIQAIYLSGEQGKYKKLTILTQPKSQTIGIGGQGLLSVVASGNGDLGYQWYKNQEPLAAVNKASIVLTNVQLPSQGQYQVIVSNMSGSVTSRVAVVAVAGGTKTDTGALWFNLADDWSDAQNPNGAWSLYKSETDLFKVHQVDFNGDGTMVHAWADGPQPQNNFVPVWGCVYGEPVWLHTAEFDRTGANVTKARWTSPSDGYITIRGGVWMNAHHGRRVGWEVRLNGKKITGGEVADSDPYDKANPYRLESGSGGSQVLNTRVVLGDTVELALISLSDNGNTGESMGVDFGVELRMPFTDTFTGGLNPSNWTIQSNLSLYATDFSNDQVRFSKPVGGDHTFQYIGLSYRPVIRGDFDVQVDFRDASIDTHDGSPGNQIQLNLSTASQVFCVVRSDEGGHNHHVWDGSVRGSQPNTAMQGTMRIVRVGKHMTAYMNGTNIFEGDYNAGDAHIDINLQNNRTLDATSVVFDNFKITADQILPEILPDLVILQAVAPSPVLAGLPTAVSWTLTNRGTLAVTTPTTTQIAISGNKNGDDAIAIGSFADSKLLAPGESLVQTGTVVIPAQLAGNRWLVVAADAGGSSVESNEENNHFVTASPLIVQAPDLQVLQINAPVSARLGESIQVSWIVANSGSSPASGTWSDRLYLGPYKNSLEGAQVLATMQSNASLPAGSRYTNGVAAGIPLSQNLAPGNYYLLVAANNTGSQPESTAENNLLGVPLALSMPPLPDLTVLDLKAPAQMMPGQAAAVSWVVSNPGSAAAAAGWSETLMASNAVDGLQPLASYVFDKTLAPGASLARTQQVILPIDGMAGETRFYVELDSGKQLVEANEANNQGAAPTATAIPFKLTLRLAAEQIAENAADPVLRASVWRNGSRASALQVTLAGDDKTLLSVPSNVTIAAGNGSASFDARVLHDGLVRGPRSVSISAAAPGFLSVTGAVTVLDADLPQLTLQLSTNRIQEGRTVAATVSRGSAGTNALTVSLGSSDAERLRAPEQVTIPAGSNTVVCTLLAAENSLIEPVLAYTVEASAPGYASTQASLTILDDDFPKVKLTLDKDIAGQSAGIQTVLGTLTLESASPQTIVVELTNSLPQRITMPEKVKITAGQVSAAFTLTLQDSAAGQATEAASIGGYVLASSMDAWVGEIVPATLLVTGSQGAALSLSSSSKIVKSGQNPAGVLTLARPTPGTNALSVHISVDDAARIKIPLDVVIPAGQSNLAFNFQTFAGPISGGSQKVKITAAAAGYNPAMESVIVADSDLPDLAVPVVTAPATAETEGYASVTYRVANQGRGPASTNFLTRVLLSKSGLASDASLLGQYRFAGALPAGQYFEQTLQVRMPQAAGTYWVIVQTDVENLVDEYQKENNTAVCSKSIRVDAGYGARVAAVQHLALAGSSMPLLGRATNSLGKGVAYKSVNIHLIVRGCERIISAITDADGNFKTSFQPLPGEAGIYRVFATHPGVSQGDPQDSFELIGMAVNPGSQSLSMLEQSSMETAVDVSNLGDSALTGLTSVIVSKPDGMQVKTGLSSTTVNGQSSVKLRCVFVSGSPASAGNVLLRLSSAEGASADAVFGISVDVLKPRLAAYPGDLYAGVLRGRQSLVEFDIVNTGGTNSGPLSVSLPDLAWVQLVSTNPMPSLDAGQTNRVILALTPSADLALAEYKGSIIVQSTTAGVSVPFVFRTLSDAKGSLRVTAVDEYTYYAEGAPNLAGAAVTVKDAYQQAVVASGVTGTNGQFTTGLLAEGFYSVEVKAEKHNSYSGSILLLAGKTNEVQSFLSRQAVQFVWSVVPIQVEDRYQIKIETVFETAVPMPVVTVEPNVIDMTDYPGEVNQMEIKVTNHGLIAAQRSQLYFPEHPNYRFTPLISDIGLLPAKSSLSIPVRIEHVNSAVKPSSLKSARPLQQSNKSNCTLLWTFNYCYPCGTNMQCVNLPFPAISLEGDCFPKPSESHSSSVNMPYIPPGSSAGPGYITGVPGKVYVSQPPISRETPNDCSGCYLVGLANCAAGCVPGVGTIYGFVFAAMNPSRINIIGAVAGAIPGYGCAAGCILSLCGCPQFKYNPCATDYANATPKWYDFWGINQAMFNAYFGGSKTSKALRLQLLSQPSLADELNGYGQGIFAAQDLVKFILEDDLDHWLAGIKNPLIITLLGKFGEFTQTESAEGAALSAEEQKTLREMSRPPSLSLAEVDRFIGRWNRTCQYWNQGILELKDVPAGSDTNFIVASALAAKIEPLKTAVEFSQQRGYDDPFTGYYASLTNILHLAAGRSGVCARVKLQLDQTAVMSRDAFQATLEIANTSESSLDKMKVQIIVKDADGADATGRFLIAAPQLTALSAVDGTGKIAAGTTGTAQWTIIPTQDAAPDTETTYFVSGTVEYEQDGAPINMPLDSTPIMVYPLPRLQVKYFHQRDVFSDDPFTEIVEPAIPFNLAVMIHNAGKGMARNFRINSAQPRIVENEKGLLIDFKIIGTEVSGQNQTPSLTASFGDLGAGTNAIGRWLMTSTLQGLFTDYKASFEHIDGLGNARASLIEEMSIHELIHIVQAPGAFEDGRPDFLVNDIGDIWSLPDTLYMSDGTTNAVKIVRQASVDSAPTSQRLQCRLSASMLPGWVYLRVPEPSNAQFKLVRIARADGEAIALDVNAWITDRTFTGLGKPPIRENNLHLLDFNSPGSYLLTYELLPDLDTTAPASSMAALPSSSYSQFPLAWSGEDEAGGSGLAFFDIFVSTDGGVFKPWLQRTTLRGAVFAGAPGSHYAFYSEAVDNAGNRQAFASSALVETVASLTNHAPVLPARLDVSINLGDTLTVTNKASDADMPVQRLLYSLAPGAPAAAYIDSNTGVLVWRTAEGGKPGEQKIGVIAADDGVPSMSATGWVHVLIKAVNTAPVLAPIADWTINEGSLLTFTNSASDTDYPVNTLTFSLGAGSPPRASIDPLTGVFRWLPVATDAPGTNQITIIVADNGMPPMSASRQFTVVVRESSSYFDLSSESTNILAGAGGMVPLYLSSRAPLKEITFCITAVTNELVDLFIQPLAPQIESISLAAERPGRWIAQAKARSGQTFTGQFTLANVGFLSLSNRSSYIASFGLNELQGVTDDLLTLTKAQGYGSRIFVIGDRPILDASLNTGKECLLVVYGRPDRTYRIQTTGSLKEPVVWNPLMNAGMNGQTYRVINTGTAKQPALYYMAR